MQSLEAELERARNLDESDIADAIESIGFACTRCGACCKAEADDPHTATVFPDEIRALQDATGSEHGSGDASTAGSDASREWRDVARPMPYGLETPESEADAGREGGDPDDAGEGDATGETFEWALQADACGDCVFYREAPDGTGACSVHDDRPLICETYPFSVALDGTSQPMGDPVDSVSLPARGEDGETADQAGTLRAHECEGLGRDIDRESAEELAAALKERAVRELTEAIEVRDAYEPVDPDGGVVVHDSEGAKRPDGSPYEG